MSHVQIDDFNCQICKEITLADLDIKRGVYSCHGCGKEWGGVRRFNKGELTKEGLKVLLYDLNGLKDNRKDDKSFNYHFDLLEGNLKDIFGVKE